MGFTDKIKENWAGYLVTGLFGGLLMQAFAMHGKLTEVSTGLTGLSQRVERIASALPDVSLRVAQEELGRPVQGVIVVSSPRKTASGKWVAPVHLLNADANTRDTYLVAVKGPEDSLPAVVASGLAISVDKTAVSFETAAKLSVQAKDPAQVPGWVDAPKSFLLRAPASDYAQTFDMLMKSSFVTVTKSTAPITPGEDLERRVHRTNLELGRVHEGLEGQDVAH